MLYAFFNRVATLWVSSSTKRFYSGKTIAWKGTSQFFLECYRLKMFTGFICCLMRGITRGGGRSLLTTVYASFAIICLVTKHFCVTVIVISSVTLASFSKKLELRHWDNCISYLRFLPYMLLGFSVLMKNKCTAPHKVISHLFPIPWSVFSNSISAF
jgi:hypothetical protein